MTQFDVVIASIPYVDTQEPLMAPALLKAVVKRTGLSCRAIDGNAEMLMIMRNLPEDQFARLSDWFLYESNADCLDVLSNVDVMVQKLCDRLLGYQPRWICLSLFCDSTKQFNLRLCTEIKRRDPNVKIVIGGNAVFTDEKSPRPYAKLLLKAGLIDHFIVGDGEEPLYNLLIGADDPGTNIEQFQVLEDLDQQPYADYDDYDWNLYEAKRIPMYASRGCVRRCTFCDVYKLWKKFKLRTAQDVFDEMLYQMERTGLRNFYFRDSLINGSISEYRRLMTLMADYNDRNPDAPMIWSSFFIFRPKTQMPEEDWQLTARSGAKTLIVGVESLVDSIRYHMRKKFTNADMDYSLEMADKYGVGLMLLLIVGYVNETDRDFQEAMTWLTDHARYTPMPIRSISVGGTLTVTDLTDLYQDAEGFDIALGEKIHLWVNKTTGLDYETREWRKRVFAAHARDLGYPVWELELPAGRATSSNDDTKP